MKFSAIAISAFVHLASGVVIPSTPITKENFNEVYTDTDGSLYIKDEKSFDRSGNTGQGRYTVAWAGFEGNEARSACVWYKFENPSDPVPFNLFEFGGAGCRNRFAHGRWTAGWYPSSGFVTHTWCDYPYTANNVVPPLDAEWHHTCVTWDGSTMIAYHDGNPAGDYSYAHQALDTLQTFSWWGSEDSRFHFRGQQKELLLIKGAAFTSQEVSAIFQGGTLSSEPPSISSEDVSIVAPIGATGCDVTVDGSGGSVSCEFSSTCNAGTAWCSLFSDMQPGTCDSDSVTLDNSEVLATTTTKDEAVLTSAATFNFAHSSQGCNLMNQSGKCVYNFCARADLWGGIASYEMSILASLVDVAVEVSYSKTGNFEATVSTAVFEAADVAASDTRSVTLSTALVNEGGCTEKFVDQETPLSVGSTARICIEPDDSDVVITGLKSVEVTYGTISKSQELVTSAGDATFIASVTGKDTNDVLLEFLMLPDFYDASNGAAGVITVSGTANLRYTSRRLTDIRKLQDTDENAPFDLEITVKKGEMPEIAKVDGHNSGFRAASGVFSIFAIAGFVIL